MTALLASVVAFALPGAADAAVEVGITSPTSGATGLTGIVNVAVTASADAGVKSVQLYVDGQAVGTPDTTPVTQYQYSIPWDTTTVSAGPHTLSAVALDWSGASQTSAPVPVGVGPPESIALTSPAAWSFVHGKSASLAATVTAAAPATVVYAVDGTTVATATSAPWAATWDSTTVPDGSHTVTATVADVDGQTAAATSQVTVDNTPPTASLTLPAAGAYATGSLAVQANASDGYGVASVQFLVDGVASGPPVTTTDTPTTYTYSATLNIASLANGPHMLTAVATDNAGNTTTTTPVTFNVGAAPPNVVVTAPVNWAFATKTTAVTATVTGGKAPYTATLEVDGKATSLVTTLATAATPASFSWSSTSVPDGAHTLAVLVQDAAGTTATSAAVQITVDNTAPTAVMYQPTALPGYTYARTNGPTTFQVHASDAYGVKSVQFTVDGNPVGSLLTAPDAAGGYLYTISFDTSTLAPGMHTIGATVVDNAGNVTQAPPLSLKAGPIVYVPVLNYHGIEGPLDSAPDEYDQTLLEAAQQLGYLKANGYQSITVEQYQTWLQTGQLPAGITKPVLITVDDGLTDELAWDPLLKLYGYKAVLYVVTGFADNTTPGDDDPIGNMSWAQIKALVADGHWEVAFHAGEYGHGEYSDAGTSINLGNGQVETFSPSCFTYYNCLGTITTTTTTTTTTPGPAKGGGILGLIGSLLGGKKTTTTTTTAAPETPVQFESQVTAEVTAGIAELKKEIPSASMISWACPWNACGQWTTLYNDPSGTLQNWVPNYFASLFPIIFTQTDPITYGLASGTVGPLNGDNRHYRFEVLTTTTLAQFAAALTDPAFANN
jgi:hypothetical protein